MTGQAERGQRSAHRLAPGRTKARSVHYSHQPTAVTRVELPQSLGAEWNPGLRPLTVRTELYVRLPQVPYSPSRHLRSTAADHDNE
ncbi:hypothetical protein SKAU_G00318220 [Synaphobranchus kaupii]|uniref:Uncharacterized protein n=1 Tax=Synaphobranchus kaupii TaxID=118154 RepID=A0A9Q1ET89_SYNKA|nr:hypothetical protein SKAU_G00318220 [Synaphobranchus kaupii]